MEFNCKNCAYFSRHYSIRGSQLIKSACGSCVKKKGGSFIELNNKTCPHYSQISIADRKAFIKTILIKMAERLDEIALILTAENCEDECEDE